MRYRSKAELLSAIRRERGRLDRLLAGVGQDEREVPGVWGDDWTVKDLLAHLAAWHEMFLRWHREGVGGGTPAMPAPGFKWNETPRLNRAIRAQHEHRPWDDVRRDFDRSYEAVLALAEALTEGELLEAGHFEWTGPNPLTTYLGANTASHYRFAVKVLRRWRRRAANS